jgi:enamidase
LNSVQLRDLPGVGMVMIDGIVRCERSRNTPPATNVPVMLHAECTGRPVCRG